MARIRSASVTAAPRKKEESSLLADIRRTFGARPDVQLLRINTGVFDAPQSEKERRTGKKPRKVRSAPTGTSDLLCIQRCRVQVRHRVETNFSLYEEDRWFYYPRVIWIETKSKTGEERKAQENFGKAMVAVECEYFIPRSVQEVADLLGPVPGWVK